MAKEKKPGGFEIKKFTYSSVKKMIEERGCILISTTYENTNKHLQLQCHCGETFTRTFWQFRESKPQCLSCSHKDNGKIQRASHTKIKADIEHNGCSLLSETYEKANFALQIQCHCGNVFEQSYNTFMRKASTKSCPPCGINQISGKLRLSYDMIENFISSQGCTLLSPTYSGGNQKFPLLVIPYWDRQNIPSIITEFLGEMNGER